MDDLSRSPGRIRTPQFLLIAFPKLWVTWPDILWGLGVIGTGYAIGYMAWAELNREVTNQLVVENTLPEASVVTLRMSIIAGISGLLALWSAVAWHWSRRGGCSPREAWTRAAHRLVPILIVPLVYFAHLYFNTPQHPWIFGGFSIMGGFAFVGIYCLWVDGLDWMSRPLRRTNPLGVLLVACLVFVVVLGAIGITRHLSHASSALDMAMMDQMMWNTAHRRFLETTFLFPFPVGFLVHHFSPILALLVPFYWIAPSPEVLVIVQVCVVAVSTVMLYASMAQITGHKWLSAILAGSILLMPGIHRGLLFDFHQDSLAMLFLSLSMYALVHEKWGWGSMTWLGALLCKEETAIYGIAIGLFMAIGLKMRLRGWAFVGLNALWLALVIYVFMPFFGGSGDSTFGWYQRYALLGTNFRTIVGAMVMNPIRTSNVLLTRDRIGGLLVLLAVALPTLRRLPAALILLLPLAINSLSDMMEQQWFSLHYTFMPCVMVYMATAYGIKDLVVHWKAQQETGIGIDVQRRLWMFAAYLLGVTTLLWLMGSPLGLNIRPTLRGYRVDRHDQLGRTILAEIPATASVIAQDNLAAHLSQRRYITLFPRQLDVVVDYYVFDVTSSTYPLTRKEYHTYVLHVMQNADYGPILVEDGYIILERGASREMLPQALQMLASYGE